MAGHDPATHQVMQRAVAQAAALLLDLDISTRSNQLMVGTTIDFFDLPVYRLPEKSYYDQRKEFVEKTMYPDEMARKFYETHYESRVAYQDLLESSYGGCWPFNEIVGYIRLHFLGLQIRGEYFGVVAKRIVKTRKKTFAWQTHKLAPEITLPHNATSADIRKLVYQYIESCRRELGNLVVDTEIFDVISPHVDWVGVANGKTR